MNQLHLKSVVVDVDGSKAPTNAAKWVVDKAISQRETAPYQSEVAVQDTGNPLLCPK